MEVPGELGPPFHQLVHKFLRADGVQVGAGVAAGGAEGQLVLLENLHGPAHLLEHAGSPAAVGGLLKALHADGGDEVFHPQHLLGKGLVDECGVGEAQKFAVAVLVAKGNEVVPAHHGLAAGVDVDIHPQLLALGDDAVDFVKGEIELVAVFRRPAAGAVEVAGGGGVQQDGPGDIAAVPRAGLLLDFPADEIAVEHKILKEGLAHPAVNVRPQAADEPVPVVVRVLDHPAEGRALGREAVGAVPGEAVHPVHQLGDAGVRVLVQIAVQGAEARPFHAVHHGHALHVPFCPMGL